MKDNTYSLFKSVYASILKRYWMQIVLSALAAFSAFLFFGILVLMHWLSEGRF
jgi:hypothetical protein